MAKAGILVSDFRGDFRFLPLIMILTMGLSHMLLLAQLCPTLCDPMDCSLPGSSFHGIFQARILEWVAIPSPGGLPDSGIKPASSAWQADSLHLSHLGSPSNQYGLLKT